MKSACEEVLTSCTTLIIHPTFEKGILSAIIPSFQKERNVIIEFINQPPKLYVIRQEGRGESDNVGLVSWPSGIYLAKYFATLENNRIMFNNKNIVELGCGCSPLPSLVLGELGANVTATDGVDSVLTLAVENININWSQNSHANASRVPKTALLKWGNIHELNLSIIKQSTIHYIIAADVIYYEKVHEELLQTLHTLSNPNTIIIIAFQIRLHAFEADFFEKKIVRYGFASKIIWTSSEPPIVKISELRQVKPCV